MPATAPFTNPLKTRRLAPEHIDSLGEIEQMAVGETYMIAGRIQLGALMDLCATFIDTLDVHYKLFERPELPAASGSEDIVPARAAGQVH